MSDLGLRSRIVGVNNRHQSKPHRDPSLNECLDVVDKQENVGLTG